MKVCSKCKEEKAEDSFAFRNKAKGIRRSECKACISKGDRKRYESPERKKAIRLVSKARRQKLIDDIWAFKNSSSCKDCGNDNPIVLEFDHLPEFEKEFNISDAPMMGFSWSKVAKEIEKCEVVCANCHVIRTHNRAKRIRNITMRVSAIR